MIAAASVIVSAAVFWLLMLCSRWVERNGRASASPQPWAVLSLGEAFQPETAILWEIQVPVLRAMSAPGGIRRARAFALYGRLARTYPELFDRNGNAFAGWIEFLEQQEIIVQCGGRVFATPIGREFIACWDHAGPQLPEPEFVGYY